MSNISDWRKRRAETEEFVTPSGLQVRLRKVSMLSLVEQGAIPTPLLSMADQVVEGKSRVELEELTEFMPLVGIVVKACVASPKVVDGDVPADDEERVSLSELTFADKLSLFDWALGSGGEEATGKLTKFFSEGE